jgi:hypothetical protein
MKRSPLKRTKPLARGTSRLSPVSKKRKAALSQYKRLRLEFLALRPTCEANEKIHPFTLGAHDCTKASSQVHHMARRGSMLNATTTWLPVCAHCHRWIETHANLSRAMGLLK